MTARPTSRLGRIVAASLLGALTLTACSGNDTAKEPTAAGDAAPFFDSLPQRIQDAKTIEVGSDIAYAPMEYYDTDGTTLLRGEATGNRRDSSSLSQGTALKMPPARMNVNSWPIRRSRRATDNADASSSSAAPRRMPMATSSPSPNACCTDRASAPIAAGFRFE